MHQIDWVAQSTRNHIRAVILQYQRGSSDQVIPLTTVSIPTLVTEGQGPIEYFSIRLTDCTLISQKGKKRIIHVLSQRSMVLLMEMATLVIGEAKGASLAIADRYGRQAIPGQPYRPLALIRSQWHCCTKLE